jgi:hypothetical protein
MIKRSLPLLLGCRPVTSRVQGKEMNRSVKKMTEQEKVDQGETGVASSWILEVFCSPGFFRPERDLGYFHTSSRRTGSISLRLRE